LQRISNTRHWRLTTTKSTCMWQGLHKTRQRIRNFKMPSNNCSQPNPGLPIWMCIWGSNCSSEFN
jgi:hypothetical protein